MSPRRLVPVILDGNVETASSIAPPRVSEIASYAVSFIEATEHTDPNDPRLTTITARIEGGRSLHDRRRIGTPFEQPAKWSSNLHADGWSAQWVSLCPPPTGPAPVELRGRVVMDYGALCSCWVRGRVTRLWMTYARRDRPLVCGDPELGPWSRTLTVWGQ